MKFKTGSILLFHDFGNISFLTVGGISVPLILTTARPEALWSLYPGIPFGRAMAKPLFGWCVNEIEQFFSIY